MRNDGEQRPRRPPRSALALLPVTDGLDGDAELGCELLLRETGTAAKVPHCRRATCFCRSENDGLQRKLLPIPQFDDPSIRFEPQAPHDPLPCRGSSPRRVKVRLTIKSHLRPKRVAHRKQRHSEPTSTRTRASQCRGKKRSRPRR